MFHFSFGEILLILVIALLVFGPKQLSELSHQLGKILSRCRRTSTEIKQTLLDAADAKSAHTDKSNHDHRH